MYAGRLSTSPERLAAAAGMAAVGLALGQALGAWLVRLPERVGRTLARVGLGVALAGAAFLFLQYRAAAGSGRGELNERNSDLPNVLLIIVDALRQDVLGAYGNERVQTPHVDGLAERGVLFENAFVQAPFTWSSFGSILTGKYPRRHGLVAMAPGLRMRRDANVTLPAHLKQALRGDGARLEDGDYAGATFMTGTLSQGSGLMSGFDCYFEALAGHELVYLDSRWSVYRSKLLLFLFKNKLTQRFDDRLVVTTAVDWLRVNAGRRFFAMLHLYSTHTPYDPPAELKSMYADPDYDGPIPYFYAKHRHAIEQGEYEPTEADVEQIKNLYYAGTTQADGDVGIVLAELERQGVLDDTLVIFTSDHGEELNDHGLWEHNWMYQTNLRIPLIMTWPNGLQGGVRVDAMVETVDILPTVCDLLDLELPPQDTEEERIDGLSLVPLIRGEAARVKEFSFAENGLFLSIQDEAWKLIVRDDAFEGEGDGWERILSGAITGTRLFHLAVDPHEMENVFAAQREEARRLYEALAEYDRGMPIPRADIRRSARDIEDERLFESLGYAGGVGDLDALEEGWGKEDDDKQ
ncbi:MAG: sulfatase-like hydrolase/transferase [Planctomycetota bacterium]|nr:sulfatase-like hydrolase/transferase [Planctomycetota bacterium]